jgi:glycosyltransferase involved in cell wall biosynthesis
MKYPFILFFRYDKYSHVDDALKVHAKNLQCTIHLINNPKKLNRAFKQVYPLVVIYGDPPPEEYTRGIDDKIICIDSSFDFGNIADFNELINAEYIRYCCNREQFRPIFSVITPAFNSFDKIIRAFNSLQKQTFANWEWIIMDDSTNEDNFQFMKRQFANEARIRLYRRHENNGYIGNIKNEAVSLARGKYVLELDHDDEILPFVLQDAVNLFEEDKEVGFIYMDFINLYENGDNFWYGEHICKGYGSYYCQKYDGKWRYVYNTPNINNITLSHLVCCPNHPRIWRKDVLNAIGNFCEYLPICDDYDVLLKTAVHTKMAKIHQMGYLQYMNYENNNFSLIRNAEINRIGPQYISPMYYDMCHIREYMKEHNAFEPEKYLNDCTRIWQRDPKTYSHKYCNSLVNLKYHTQYCIVGMDALLKHLDKIILLYENCYNDFIVVEHGADSSKVCKKLDELNFSRMKCTTFTGATNEELVRYFKMCYLSAPQYEILTTGIVNQLPYNTLFSHRHMVINSLTEHLKDTIYLEIGVETGYTIDNVRIARKIGVDPDPKCLNMATNITMYKCTSDDFFKMKCSTEIYSAIFIDGMHQCEYVLRDFNNSILALNKPDGYIFIDDCIPNNYNEQLKIPLNPKYENGILKYSEEWTGDVWKFVYHLIKYYRHKITYQYFHHSHYRGIIGIKIFEPFQVQENEISDINKYDYFNDFNDYIQLLTAYAQLL